MGLPPFEELEIYIAGDADLPQRYFIEPEKENYADWKVSIENKILPVHSAILGLQCEFFCGMLNEDVQTKEPIKLPGTPVPTMAHTLAFLRFVYYPDSITEQNIYYLMLHGSLCGVIRLAHTLNCPGIFEKCKNITKKSLELDYRELARGCERIGNRSDLDPAKLLSDVHDIALDIKDDDLVEACYTHVANRCYYWGASQNYSIELVRELGDSPDLLRAGLFSMLHRNKNLTGYTIRKLFSGKEHVPPALYTFKYQVTADQLDKLRASDSDVDISLDPEAEVMNEDFCWEEYPVQPSIEFYTGGQQEDITQCYLYLNQNIEWAHICSQMEITFRFLNWNDPSRSITKKVIFPEEGDNILVFLGYNQRNHDNETNYGIPSFFDDRGIFYVQVEEIKVLSIEN